MQPYHMVAQLMYIDVHCLLALDLVWCPNLSFLYCYFCYIVILHIVSVLYTIQHGLLPTYIVSEWGVLHTIQHTPLQHHHAQIKICLNG